MDEKRTKLYMEMQMEELRESLAPKEKAPPPVNNQNKNAEIAKLYEDAADYEEQLAYFEKELSIIKSTHFEDLAKTFQETPPNTQKNYKEELHNVLIATWIQFVENGQQNAQEQLEVIKTVDFSSIVAKLQESFSSYEGDFETEIKKIFIKRHETLIAIMKEHIKEEFYEIKIRGLKPNFVKRIYQEFHGIEPK